ncbi:MAG: amino acid deaminase/aldolase, partial [Myxococcota bacterium]
RLQALRGEVVATLRSAGHEISLVNGGGTGSLESTRSDPSVTELTAGSGFFSPALFDGYQGFRHAPAAGFALPVVRRPRPNIVTCHGGGYIASGAAGEDRLPVPTLPPGGALLPLEGAGEVQTPVRFERPPGLALGEPVFFRHAKAGELCERFSKLALIDGTEVVDEVSTYRGEGWCFL